MAAYRQYVFYKSIERHQRCRAAFVNPDKGKARGSSYLKQLEHTSVQRFYHTRARLGLQAAGVDSTCRFACATGPSRHELCALHALQSMTPGALSAFLGHHIVTAAGAAAGGCTEELRGLRRSLSLSRPAPGAAWGDPDSAGCCPSVSGPCRLPPVVLPSMEDATRAPLPALLARSPPAPACASDAWWGGVMEVGFCAAGRLEVIRMAGSRRGPR